MKWLTRIWPIIQAILETLRGYWASKGAAAGGAQAKVDYELDALKQQRELNLNRESIIRVALQANRAKLSDIDQRIRECESSLRSH